MKSLTPEQQHSMMAELVATIERVHLNALGTPQRYEVVCDVEESDQLTILLRVVEPPPD